MYINTDELDELTHDFISSFPTHTHMSWSEWRKKAKTYGLDRGQITELKQYLETNKQLTSPIRFAGHQWWLTSQEIKHIEALQKASPNNWEEKALDLMQRRKL